MSYLVIVESPAKANTIKGYLGSNYKVIASKGHIRDLPKSSLGVDVKKGFEPHYINIRGKGDVIKELKKEAKNATKIFLATDPDREGEAISWHIATQLGIPEDTACRITFNEITKAAVKDSVKHPRVIDRDLVNSQQARRILDRIVGFSLSELLWKNVKSGLSGGRVQSVAARIIAEREEEIDAFVPVEYWTMDSQLKDSDGDELVAKFFGDKNGKIRISCKQEADIVEERIKSGSFKVSAVRHSEKYRIPSPPFTTSTLQQEASKRLGFQSQRIMKIAQELYDGLNLGAEFGGVQGLITYMRTDSTRISQVAKDACAEFVRQNYGENALPGAERSYKTGANSQDAHEAIRPSNVNITPKLVRKYLTNEQFKIYKLIWERFVASQMQSAVLDTVSVDIENSGYIFKSGGYVVKSKGYLAIYEDSDEDNSEEDNVHLTKLMNVKEGDELSCIAVNKQQHYTEPPARYTEASLIKFLEENGIGRPSTYAPIISIITDRDYVKRDGKSLVATPLGKTITKYMKENFAYVVDYEFTAIMENRLDSIANKENTIEGVIGDFYKHFERELADASDKTLDGDLLKTEDEVSEVKCALCGADMVYKDGKPQEPAELKLEPAGFKCETCGGEMVIRHGKFGEFYACSNYPTCKFTKQKVIDIGVACPRCSSKVVGRHGKGKMLFFSCEKHPECDFSSWDMPLNEKCPDCGDMLYYRKSRRSVTCKNPSCDYKREEEMTVPN